MRVIPLPRDNDKEKIIHVLVIGKILSILQLFL